jgi:hypothetical protein
LGFGFLMARQALMSFIFLTFLGDVMFLLRKYRAEAPRRTR